MVVQAHQDLGAKHSIAIHFGTFQLSDEAFGQPEKDLVTALKAAGLTSNDFAVLHEGESRLFEK